MSGWSTPRRPPAPSAVGTCGASEACHCPQTNGRPVASRSRTTASRAAGNRKAGGKELRVAMRSASGGAIRSPISSCERPGGQCDAGRHQHHGDRGNDPDAGSRAARAPEQQRLAHHWRDAAGEFRHGADCNNRIAKGWRPMQTAERSCPNTACLDNISVKGQQGDRAKKCGKNTCPLSHQSF